MDRLSEYNSSRYFHVIADKDYDQTLEKKLQDIINTSGRMSMRTWKAEYEQWRTALATTRGASYAFLGILAAISVMNLINTMINSVHVPVLYGRYTGNLGRAWKPCRIPGIPVCEKARNV